MLEKRLQGDVNQLIMEVENTAIEMSMKMRFLDAIRDVKNTLKKPLSQQELRKVMLEIDELISQIRKQVEPEQKLVELNDYSTITEEEIKSQIQKMLADASKRNPSLLVENLAGSEIYIQETKEATWDFAKAEANYEIISDIPMLCEKFENIGKRYNQMMNQMVDAYIDAVADNYDNCVNRIGKMLCGIEDSRLKFGQKELYKNWSETSHVVKKNIKQEIEQMDKGGEVILGLIRERENALEKILRKIKQKYFMKKCLPLYIILGILAILIGGIVWLVTGIVDFADTTIDGLFSLAQEQGLDKILNTVIDNVPKIIKKIIKNVLPTAAGTVIGTAGAATTTGAAAGATAGAAAGTTVGATTGIVTGFVIIGIPWYLWIKRQNKKCKKKIVEEMGKYMYEQLDTFWNENPLHMYWDKCSKVIVEKVTNTYETSMMQVFGGILYNEADDTNSPIYKMFQLCNEWEKIKRGNI